MEICTVGGFEAVGRNMTAVKIEEDVFIIDAGVDIPSLFALQNDNVHHYTEETLRKAGAIPNDLTLDKLGWTDKVRAIIIGHAHLDHVGALPYIAHRYPNAVIMGTPFTMAVLDTLTYDARIRIKNPIKIVKQGSVNFLKGKSGDYKIEFVHVTHSTIQCSSIALHTKEGVFYYAVDFKLDDTPTIESPPNYRRMKEIGKEGVKVLVVNSLYSGSEGRTPSESIAKKLLKTSMESINDRKSAIFITTFSSHIARLQSIVEFGKKTGRKIVFLGRSLDKYVNAAIKANGCTFRKSIEIKKYRNQVNSFLREVDHNRGKYLVVCTGHQGEEGSILDRISKGETPFKFRPGDHLIFSSKVIPVPENIKARKKMDAKLEKQKVNLQKNIHVSGHGCKEDLRELIKMLNPKYLIPTHGTPEQEMPMIEISKEFGYKFGKTSLLSQDGKVLKF